MASTLGAYTVSDSGLASKIPGRKVMRIDASITAGTTSAEATAIPLPSVSKSTPVPLAISQYDASVVVLSNLKFKSISTSEITIEATGSSTTAYGIVALVEVES